MIRGVGGGLITLRSDGWWQFGGSLLIFILVSDLYAYWSHRLSHLVPALWAMHSFHHSAEAMTLITGARHHWLETLITSACFPLMAVLFNVPPAIATTALFIGFLPNGCVHLNVRFGLGRYSTWVNSPQWHRIHHSVQPEHMNKNFAAILPLWDLVFGTAWIPGADEFPDTGLVAGENPGLVEAVVWPFRHSRIFGKLSRREDQRLSLQP
jgi:sterol desaturase/sphingolipid hydroxylase (fatty acid hydroxylase superfamily)